MRVDLHIHTTASDGRWTPEEVSAGVQAEGMLALFGLIYPATHPLAVAETWLLRLRWPARIFAGISFLIAMFAALTSIPAGR